MITRRKFLKTGAFAASAIIAVPMINRGRFQLFADSKTEYSERAVRLVRENIVVDMLNNFESSRRTTDGEDLMDFWMRKSSAFTEADFKKYRETGINVFALGWNQEGGSYDFTLDWMAHVSGFIATYDDWFMRIDSASDFERVHSSGKLGILFSTQNSKHFRTVDDVDYFYGLGQRVSQLTYNKRNLIGNGAFEQRDEGLSDYGLQIIERMNKVGMAIDSSHCADQTTLDAIENSQKPIVITHAACRVLVPNHLRSKTDETIKKLAAKGGVMGIPSVRFLIRNEEPTTVEHLLDQFDYAAKLVGAEHIGIGTDYPLYSMDTIDPAKRDRERANQDLRYNNRGRRDQIDGVDDIKRIYDLTEGLIRRKYSDANIKLILGDNFKRVLSEIWTAESK